MALARVGTLSTGSSVRRLPRAIFLFVRLRSAPISSGVVAPDVSHPSASECPAPTSSFDQTAGQSAGENLAVLPALPHEPSGFPCSRSVAVASSATLLLLTQCLVCCVHRLNPSEIRVVRQQSLRAGVHEALSPISLITTRSDMNCRQVQAWFSTPTVSTLVFGPEMRAALPSERLSPTLFSRIRPDRASIDGLLSGLAQTRTLASLYMLSSIFSRISSGRNAPSAAISSIYHKDWYIQLDVSVRGEQNCTIGTRIPRCGSIARSPAAGERTNSAANRGDAR